MLINSQMKYLRAENISDALKKKEKYSKVKFLAGGTDLIPLMKYGVKNPEYLIDISKLSDLNYILCNNKYVSIGALTRLNDIANNTFIKESVPFLSYAAKCVASPQIRNMATLGGNILQDRRCMYFNQTADWRRSIDSCFKTGGEICHQVKKSSVCKAIYYSDIAPVLLALNATATIIEKGVEKEISVEELILKHSIKNGTVKNTDMLVKSFKFKYYADSYNKFYKYSVRQSIDFPTMNIAIFFNPYEKENNDQHLRIFIGAVSSYPIELKETENSIVNYLCESNCNVDINEICQNAIAEINKKCGIVRETGISLKAKKTTFNNIEIAIKDFIQFWKLNVK